MRVATVRDVQHRLKEVLEWIAAGESIQITSRGRVVARLVPPQRPKRPAMPDFLARMARDFPQQLPGEPLSRIIDEQRGH